MRVRFEHVPDMVGEVLNRDDPVGHAERVRQLRRDRPRRLGIELRRQVECRTRSRAKRVDRDRQGERRVDAAETATIARVNPVLDM